MKTLFKRRLCLILSLMLAGYCQAQDLWDGTTASSFHGGSGTEEDPYQIRTGAQLMYFVSQINAGNDFTGKTVKLMNDIDMYRNAFYAKKTFSGTFDGGSHFLTLGFNTRWIALESGRYANEFPVNQCPYLFELVYGRIHHLGIKGLSVSSSEGMGGYYATSRMAIANTLEEGGIIEDCYYILRSNYAAATGYLTALAVYNSGTISNCCVESTTYRYDGRVSDAYFGGIVYYNRDGGIIQNCFYNNDNTQPFNDYIYGAGSIIYDGSYGNNTEFIGKKYTWQKGYIENYREKGGYVRPPLNRKNYGVISNSTSSSENSYDEYIETLNQWVSENPSHDHWCTEGKKLESFNSGDECLVEFIDTKFNLAIPTRTVNAGETVGELPTANEDWTLVGWTRLGNLIGSDYIVNSNLTLFARWEQRIRKQPTSNNLSVVVDDAANASYQWYRYVVGEGQSLGEWTSTNHSDDSSQKKEFTFSARSGCKIEFDYLVSSEESGDFFSAYIKPSGATSSTLLASKSGEVSGHIEYAIVNDGEYILTLYYRKDEDTSNGDDKVCVTNIRISDRIEELGTSAQLSQSYIDKKGLYYCVVTYSNTGVTLTSDIVDIENVDFDTDISLYDNAIYAEATEGIVGNTMHLDVKMKNTLTPVGCSFILTLPDGWTLAKDDDGNVIYKISERADKLSVTMKDWNDGTYNFALTGTSTISGNDGPIISFSVCIPDDAVAGDYMVRLTKNLIQTKNDGMIVDNELPDIVTTITVHDGLLGDVNDDGKVTPSDAIMILYHYFNVELSDFQAFAADVNHDGAITPSDAIEALYMYFEAGHNNAPRKIQQTLQTLEPQ